MEKTVIIKTNRIYFAISCVILVIYTVMILLSINDTLLFYSKQWYLLILILCCIIASTRTVICTKEGLALYYAYICVRRIPTDRITSVEFIMYQNQPYIIFGIDGHPLFENSLKPFKRYMYSFNVISIPISERLCDEYSEQIPKLFSNATFVNWKK